MVLPALVGFVLLLAVGLIGSAVLVTREAAAVHPMLGWAVGAVAGLGFLLLVVWPVAAVLRLPRTLAPPAARSGRAWNRYVLRYARRLATNDILREDYDGFADLVRLSSARNPDPVALEKQMAPALEILDERAREAVSRHAATVFAGTAVSQSGRLDGLLVTAGQLRTVRDVARIYYQRPTPGELVRVYGNVAASAFVATEIQDSQLIAVLGAPVSAAVAGLVPLQGTDPLVSLLVNSLLVGSANGFLTLRVGALARRYCGLSPDLRRDAVSASASVEAAGMLAAAISSGAGRIASATRRLVVQGALVGTGRVARGVATAGTGALGKMAGMIDQAARHVGRQAKRPPQWVISETLRFWEAIAGGEAPDVPCSTDESAQASAG